MDTLGIIKNLESIGLSDKESKIVIYLASKRESGITELWKKTNIPRSSIYRYLDNLERQGLITYKLSSQGKRVALSNFGSLKSRLEEDKKEIDRKKIVLDELLESMNTLSPVLLMQPSIRYFEGKEGIRQLIWNTLKAESEIKAYTNAIRKELVGEKWMIDYCMEFVNRDLNEKVLGDINYAQRSYQVFGGREQYFSPVREYYLRSDERILNHKMLNIQGEIYIYDNIISFYTWEGDNLVGSEIESEFISNTQGSIFDLLWQLTTEEDSVDKY